MKSILQIVVVLNLSLCLHAQPFGEAAPNYRIKKLEYENSSGEKAHTHFKYDQNGKLFKPSWSLDNKNRSSINFYEHDDHGWLISAYREFSDGLTSFELFSYDSPGNKISEYFYRSDSVSGFATYQYEENCLKQADFKNHKGWLNGIVKYQYNEQNKKKNAVLLKDKKTICHISYEYDSNLNLIKEFWDFQGKWRQTFLYHYEKIDMNKYYYSSPFLSNSGRYRISKEDYTFNNKIGGPSYYYYDAEGLLYKKEFIRSDSLSTITFYEYDSERKLIASQRSYSDGSSARFTYYYDENSNLILRSSYKGDTLAGFESYLYNSEGDLIKAYVKNLDSWLTGTISFQINKLGIIKHGKFKGENGFDAFISFNYNTEGLLTEINWEFSFGKYQQYIFEYESVDSP